MATTETAAKPGLEKDYPAKLYTSEYHTPEYVAYLDRAAAAIKSLKLIVLGLLAISIVLGVYGFFLIYQLTRDSHRMVDEMATMGRNIAAMQVSVSDMRGSVADLRDGIADMNRHVASMDASVAHMASTVGLIQHSTSNLDRSFGPAMGMLNNFMPFGAGGNSWRGAPPYAGPPPR